MSSEHKTMQRTKRKTLNVLLNELRDMYNFYDEDDKEVIDAIHVIQEELVWNIDDEEQNN